MSIKLDIGNLGFDIALNRVMAIDWEDGARSFNTFTRNKRKMDTVVPKNDKQSKQAEKLTQEQVGNKLKQLYADVVAEPVPDRFMDLIEQLDSVPEPKSHSGKKDKQKESN